MSSVLSPCPKIELHVHLEGAVRPRTLLEIARRNGVRLPADDDAGLARFYEYRDFGHFLEVWLETTAAIRTEDDFRRIVVAYATEAAAHGAVYLEGIFTPVERIQGGASWDEVFAGFCDGAEEAAAETGVIVRLTPDIPRGADLEVGMTTARYAAKYRDRGVVAIGIGGPEAHFPPEPWAPAFTWAKSEGLGSVPHAGEAAGPASVRGALDALGADRIRHGIRAVEDAALVEELGERGVVCDVCPISNLRTGVVASIDAHPLEAMTAAGVRCTINTDDPAMFGTDLGAEHALLGRLGYSSQGAYAAGVAGALCDEVIKRRLRAIGEAYKWSDASSVPLPPTA